MNDKKNEIEVIKGESISEIDLFYLRWGRESLKNNITLANDILKQLITLSTALLGVSIIYDKIVSNEIIRIFVITSFIFGLIISFVGVLPYEEKVDILSPSEIKEHKHKALNHKRNYLWIASFFIVSGFFLIIAELVFKLIK